jgi:hypothetical protein
MKRTMIVMFVLAFCFSKAQALLLSSSEIIGPRKFVLQLGYGSSNYGSQATFNRGGMDFKLGYGLVYPWDVLFSAAAGSYPQVSNQTFQYLGLDLRYGVVKAMYGEKTPLDISILIGVMGNKTFVSGSQTAQETEYHVAAVIGRSYRKPTAYITPYLGLKLSSTYNASGAWSRSGQEITLGLKYGLNSALSLMAEGNYSWVDSVNKSVGWGAGLAWKF